MIRAECHTNDMHMAVRFDATEFFKICSIEQIYDLARWGNKSAVEDIVFYMEDFNDNVKEMLAYYKSQRHIGFECNVDEMDFLIWLRDNRPKGFEVAKSAYLYFHEELCQTIPAWDNNPLWKGSYTDGQNGTENQAKMPGIEN
jgi:hypothetical protein